MPQGPAACVPNSALGTAVVAGCVVELAQSLNGALAPEPTPQQIELVTRDDSSGPRFLRVPSGVSYMLTSRRVMKQVFEAVPGACSMGLTRHF